MLQDKMSMTGSLMGYENNNDVNQAKCKKPLKPLPVVSSISSSGVTTSTAKPKKARRSTKKDRRCAFGHINNLWSVWYGTLAVGLQAYIGLRCARRFSSKIALFHFIPLKYAFVVAFRFDCVSNIDYPETWFTGPVISLSNKISYCLPQLNQIR